MSGSEGRAFSAFNAAISICACALTWFFFVNSASGLEATEEQETGKQGETSSLEEIVVTATKREESVQRVPISVTALSDEALEKIGAVGFAGITEEVPGLVMNTGAQGREQFIIRGLDSQNQNVNIQSTVATLIDDIPTGSTFAPIGITDLDLFDVERVEVLRGPQGTLFGSGSIGGVIRVITAKPKLDVLEGKIETGAAGTNGGGTSDDVKGMINIPVVDDVLAFRITATYSKVGGYINEPLQNRQHAAAVETKGGRFVALFRPTQNLDVTASFIYQRSIPDGDILTYTHGQLSTNQSAPVVALPPYTSTDFVPNRVIDDKKIGNVVIDYNLGWASLFSSTTYMNNNVVRITDNSAAYSPFSSAYTGTLLPQSETDLIPARDFAEEVRLTSRGDSPFSWLLGGFFYDENRAYNAQAVLFPSFAPAYQMFGENGTNVITNYHENFRHSETANFGELAYRFTDQWKLSVSGRYFWDKNDYSFVDAWFFGELGTAPESSRDHGFTPRVALSYTPTDSLLYYASVAKGYRAGGPNGVPIPGTPPSYGPDTNWAYELGAKTTLFDRRLRFNTALFYNHWTGIQLSSTRPSPFTGQELNFIENGPTAHTEGIEIEVDAKPIHNLELTWATAYTIAKADATDPTVFIAQGGVHTGDMLPGSPKFTSTETVRYSIPWPSIAGSVYGEVVHQYVGTAYNGFDHSNPGVNAYGDWHRVDLRAGIVRGKYEAILYVNNLLNGDTVTNWLSGSTTTEQIIRMVPRTAGVTLRLKF